MIAVIAPAKRMRKEIAYMEATSKPRFLRDAEKLKRILQNKEPSQLKHILRCSESIAQETYALFSSMRLRSACVPALLAYDGIQYSYMACDIFTDEQYAYVQEHVRILSGFYGVLRPLDGVAAYRLEINDPLRLSDVPNLYAFWQDKIYRSITQEDNVILDLASTQYSCCITRYLTPDVRYIKCRFYEDDGKHPVEKGVYVKIARGEMVRFMAEHHVREPEEIKAFTYRGYHFDEERSSANEYCFYRKVST